MNIKSEKISDLDLGLEQNIGLSQNTVFRHKIRIPDNKVIGGMNILDLNKISNKGKMIGL